ncbi:Major facilitator superfamily domain, general substrate transporter [Penicillium expansum]|uniref:Major facilitator superfamily domain, general substrate transporter n=1 Tax=Penicillium expansum TaxID=27334 RepID=A0A0A2K2I3_PENEN|nr:Major facilitator superfamily domain, general substrate transporter [Penicillium expansum]KGO61942.1 Major facilitator superfamily domain, general substrate transporter [Penicillium expansum]
MVLMSHALGRSIEDVTMLTAYQLLACACYGPIGSALAHKYGKRPQFIFASVMGFVGTLVCCTTGDNYGVLLAGRIIQGFGSAVFESLTVAVMGDMFFVHERSLRTGLLVMTWTCIISLVSILGGVIAEGLGWRYVFIIHLPFTVVGLLSVFFFLPETQWKGSRSHISSEAADQAEDKEMASVSHGHEENLSESSLPEAKKTFMQEIAIFSGTHTDANLLRLVFAPFAVIINPAVIWSIAVGGACIGFYVAISYILAQIWTPPPYNLNAHQNGTFYVGALIGGTWPTTIGSGSDAFRENSTEIFILLMTAKNFIFYGFSQVMNTWAEEKDPSDVLRTFGIITMCLIGTSPVLYIFGKVNRSFMHKTRLMRRLTGEEDVLRSIP